MFNSKFKILSLSILLLLITVIISPSKADAVLYNASGMLGHYNADGSPDYTSSYVNNGHPNDKGFATTYGSLAIDRINHHLFVSDTGNNRVLVFQMNNNNTDVSSHSAINVLGQPNFTTNTLLATSASTITAPRGIYYDSDNGRLFVSDTGSSRILIFSLANGISNNMPASNVLGQPDFTSSSTAITQSGLNNPRSINYDSISKLLFIADTGNHRVMIFDLTNGISNNMPAVHEIGQIDFVHNTAAVTPTISGFNNPRGLTYDNVGKRLFVADWTNNRVLVFNLSSGITDGMNASNVLGQTSFTTKGTATSQSGFSQPNGADYDTVHKRLFVTENINNRVLVFDLSSGITGNGMAASHILGQTDFVSGITGTTQKKLSFPVANVYDPINNLLFVPDGGNNRVMIYDVSSINDGQNAVSEIGQYDSNDNINWANGTTNGVMVNDLGFSSPDAMSIDAVNHRLFIGEINNSRVLVYNLDANNNIASSTPAYVLGQPDFVSNSVITPPTNKSFYAIHYLVYDSTDKRLFVSDTGNNRVLVFDLNNGIQNYMPASFVLGQPDFTTNTYSVNNTSVGQDDATYDPINKRLFTSDELHNRVMVWNANPLTMSNGEQALYVLGQPDFTHSAQATTVNGSWYPCGLFYDSISDRLFVSENKNNRVVVFDFNYDPIHNGMNARYVFGQNDFTHYDPNITQNGLNGNADISYDQINKILYVCDDNNNRVMVYNVANVTNGMGAVNVFGQADFVSSTARITQNGIGGSLGNVLFSPSNKSVFVAEEGNNRVIQYKLVNITNSGTLTSANVGSTYSKNITTENSQNTLSYSLYNGTLPNGLSLNANTGVISGIPTTETTSTFTIEADDTSSTGSFFDRASFTLTVKAPVPVAPSDVTVTSNSTTSLHLSWTDNSSDETEFVIDQSTNGIDYNNILHLAANTLSTDINNLSPNTTYYFRIVSSNSNGISVYAYGTGYTLSNIPSNFTGIKNAGQSFVTLNWIGDATSYYVENVNDNLNSGWINSTNYVFSNLYCSKNYNFRVKARNINNTETDWNTWSVDSDNCHNSGMLFLNTINKTVNMSIVPVVPPFEVKVNSTEQKATCSISRNLKENSTGTDVLCLQKYLYDNKYLSSKKDLTSFFGPKTKKAVIVFQKKNKLIADGIFGEKSRKVGKY